VIAMTWIETASINEFIAEMAAAKAKTK